MNPLASEPQLALVNTWTSAVIGFARGESSLPVAQLSGLCFVFAHELRSAKVKKGELLIQVHSGDEQEAQLATILIQSIGDIAQSHKHNFSRAELNGAASLLDIRVRHFLEDAIIESEDPWSSTTD